LRKGNDALPEKVILLPGALSLDTSNLPAPTLGLLTRSLVAFERLLLEPADLKAASRLSFSDAILLVTDALALALSGVCHGSGVCALSLGG
jgi:hypothetical protein